MVTTEEWRQFLQTWSDEWLKTDERFPQAVRTSRWLGFDAATGAQIEKMEKGLGYRLPPSFRAFLLTTNGWRKTTLMIGRIRPVNKIEWLEVDDPQFVDINCDNTEELKPFDGVRSEDYYAYDGRPIFDRCHLKLTLKIGDPADGDTAIYLLNPMVMAENGEWEAWLHAHWIPGAIRYPSFAQLMRAEYESFHLANSVEEKARQVIGPYDGVYAPNKPRYPAERIGRGKRRLRRLSVEELIGKLEDSSRKTRLETARQLFREYKPHDPDDERPKLVEPLRRILESTLEVDVRTAAAYMLGSYGDQHAVAPLVAALEDADIAGAAVSALHYLSLLTKDSRIAEGLCEFLNSPRDPTSTSTAISILEDLADPRLASIALRVLDGEADSQLRIQAAFALVVTSDQAADYLMSRLTHENPEIRTAAAAALRKTNDRRAVVLLRAALDDTDANVRMQAEMSLRFFEHAAQASSVEIDEAVKQIMERLRKEGLPY